MQKTKTMKKSLLIFLFLGTSTFIFAQDISTDRPDQTESSTLMSVKNIQIETGVILANTPNLKANLLPTTLFRYGLNKGLELRLLVNYSALKEASTGFKVNGFNDLEIGAKIQLKEKKESATEIAFLTHVSIPTAKASLTAQNIGTLNRVLVSHSLSEKSAIAYNIGYTYFGYGNGDGIYTLSFSTKLSNKAFIYIEPYGVYENFSTLTTSFDTGIAYSIKNNVQVDFSYGTGLNHQMNFVSFGVSWNVRN